MPSSESACTRPAGVAISDESGSSALAEDVQEMLGRLTGMLYARLHLSREVELTVTLVDEARMAQLHLDWMDLPGPTDVMSLPMDELRPGTAEEPVAEGMLGDIVICPEVARRQAEAAGHGTGDELALLTVHGVLHLLGHDHVEQDERQVMFALQARLLEEFLGRRAPTPTVDGP
ncbi:rRNA maturation RNase YbeY [Nesterenkonia sp. CL21]|uniref:rRNA maturation RNase YbeY n=1 Tax=unclassified Nesterenkonia TaxID=2629769 RepID=UPI000A19CECE|nr:rRNA maturation RNase YbeY [Nesterenkonia sp. PF2B19]